MKFLSLVPLYLAATAYAQGIVIETPTTGQTLTRGQNITVEVTRPDTLSGSTEIGIAIGIADCNETPCEDHSEDIGDVLYAGAYTPVLIPGSGSAALVQNFTVTVPTSLSAGPAVLSVVHAYLIGAGQDIPELDVENVTVTLA